MSDDRGYQDDYSEINPLMHEERGRRRKAETMRLVLQEKFGDRLKQLNVLNLGCSAGLIDLHLSEYVGQMVGVDIDQKAIKSARERTAEIDNVRFEVADAMQLPFARQSFDVVICSQVYEHVPNAQRMMAEIERVLTPGGCCYFAATNRWALVEMHYRLPFLSWLPPRLADMYVRALGRSDRYYERHLGVGGLRDLTNAFEREEMTLALIMNPARYATGYLFPRRFSRHIARAWLALAHPIFPGFIWLLWKKSSESSADPIHGD